MDRARMLPWVVRAAWAVLPFVAGPALAAALDGRSESVRTSASVLLWAVWTLTLCASLVLHPISLTVVRTVAPAAVVAGAWASAATPGGPGLGLLALAASVVSAGLVFLPETGVAFVNGPAYPNEIRFPLRVPGAVLLGPLYVAWAAVAGLPVAAVLLLASGQWVLGAAAALFGGASVVFLGRSLHGLSRRWVVFVPAGLVLHDPQSLADPVLFPKAKIGDVVVAAADTTALDLTQHAPGLALELRLLESAPLVLAGSRGGVGVTSQADAVLFAPTRLGRVLTEVQERLSGRSVVDADD